MFEEFFHGCVSVQQKGNLLIPKRFPDHLIEFYGMKEKYQLRARNTAGIVLKVLTSKPFLTFKAYPSDFSRSDNTFSIFENKRFVENVHFSQDDKEVLVHYTCRNPQKGKTLLEIYFPVTATVAIAALDFNNLSPVGKTQKELLCLGDSITQGMVAQSAAFSYAGILSRALDMELHNLGVGGFHFDADSLKGLALNPSLITVAYGTNDFHFYNLDIPKILSKADAYFQALSTAFKDIPIFVLSPIWRADFDTSAQNTFVNLGENLLQLAQDYGFHTVSGMTLVDHDISLFSDQKIHPNVQGFIQYADRLLSEIVKVRDNG
jgi:lysophospholipase L1-like esterase